MPATLALLLTCLCLPLVADEDITADYQALHAAGDRAGLASLFQANPDAILVTIDADLEAGLSAWEQDPTGRSAEDTAGPLHARALWAAQVASAATGRPIFADYASAFVGWSPEQKQAFRNGQRAFGRGRGLVANRDLPGALAAAVECRTLALPLGDWWGAAMGYSLEGQVLVSLDRAAEAVAPLGQARLIYAQLGLVGPEYGCVTTLADCLASLEAWPRVRQTADAGLALARKLGDGDGELVLLGRRREAELALGLDDAAIATAAELDALREQG